MSRFLAYVSPAVGHTLPLVPGLLELHDRGHDVHVVGLPAMVDTLRAAGLDASPVSDAVMAREVTDYQADTDTERLRAGQVDLVERGWHDGPDLVAAIERFRPDALLIDCNAYGARTWAEASGLPWAMLLPSVIPYPGKGIPPYGPGMKPGRGPLGWARDRVLWKVMERVFAKAILPGLNELRADAGLPAYRSPLDAFQPPATIIATTAEPLEYHRTDLPDNFHLVGTLPWDAPAERPAYLDEPGDPWVLVTCSTDYQGDEDLARKAVAALADEPVRVLLTLADAYEKVALPPASNIRVERFVPHGHVLPECAAVVCHGGMGIVTRAASSGVPMVVVPWGRDQPEIARRVIESGAGVQVRPKELTPQKLREAVRTAMTMQESAREVADRLDPEGSAARFADAALTLVPDSVSASAAPAARTA